jgi:phospholipid/cholesterol/gamma-HCH transport system permease protein
VAACHRGLSAGPGARGVAGAVVTSVGLAVLLLFAANAILSAAYFQLVPPRGS